VPDSKLFLWPSWSEWWSALRWLALIVAVMVALTLAGSFADYGAVVESGQHPWLPPSHCKGCFMCGMTRSFCAMSSGRLSEALAWNRAGPALYAGFWLYLAGAVGYGLNLIRRKTKTKRPPLMPG